MRPLCLPPASHLSSPAPPRPVVPTAAIFLKRRPAGFLFWRATPCPTCWMKPSARRLVLGILGPVDRSCLPVPWARFPHGPVLHMLFFACPSFGQLAGTRRVLAGISCVRIPEPHSGRLVERVALGLLINLVSLGHGVSFLGWHLIHFCGHQNRSSPPAPRNFRDYLVSLLT